MPKRQRTPTPPVAAEELASLLGIVSHPLRLRLIETLERRECDVATLQQTLDLRQPVVSHHLSLLRAHHIVTERREGRHVFYRLTAPEIAAWLLNGLRFLGKSGAQGAATRPRRTAARRVASR